MTKDVIITDRLILRNIGARDAETIATLIDNYKIAVMLARVPYPYKIEDARQFIALTKDPPADERVFALCLKDKAGTLIGICSYERRQSVEPELGYWLGVPYWGNGYATEAARAVIDHAFADLGCDALVSGARVSNPASRRVLEKCGFQWTGVGLYRIRALNSSAPIDRFRLDRRLWASLKSWGNGKQMA